MEKNICKAEGFLLNFSCFIYIQQELISDRMTSFRYFETFFRVEKGREGILWCAICVSDSSLTHTPPEYLKGILGSFNFISSVSILMIFFGNYYK